jgi:hypothetical protein
MESVYDNYDFSTFLANHQEDGFNENSKSLFPYQIID